MFQTLARVNAGDRARAAELPPPPSHRRASDVRRLPIMGYSLTSDSVPHTRLWELATYELKPRLNRMPGVSTVVVQGGQIPESKYVPIRQSCCRRRPRSPRFSTRRRSNLIDSPGLYEDKHQLVLSLVSGQARSQEDLAQIVVKTTPQGFLFGSATSRT